MKISCFMVYDPQRNPLSAPVHRTVRISWCVYGTSIRRPILILRYFICNEL